MNLELRSTQRTLGHWRMSMDLTSTLQRRLVSAWRRWAIILIWVLKPINICDKYIQLFKYIRDTTLCFRRYTYSVHFFMDFIGLFWTTPQHFIKPLSKFICLGVLREDCGSLRVGVHKRVVRNKLHQVPRGWKHVHIVAIHTGGDDALLFQKISQQVSF